MKIIIRFIILLLLLTACKKSISVTELSDSGSDSIESYNHITNETEVISYEEIVAIEKKLQPAFFVSAQGNDENTGRSVNDAFKTLSKAIEIAAESANKKIFVIGTLNQESEGKENSQSVFSIQYQGESEITISGVPNVSSNLQARLTGTGTNNRVIKCNGKIRFENIEIRDANTKYPGAGISGGSFVIGKNTKIMNNKTTNNGGGIYVDKGCIIENGASIINNTALNGGGLYLPYSWNTITNNGGEISYNTALNCGGGVYILDAENNFKMNAGIIKNNSAGDSGGGIYAADNCVLQNVTLKENTAKKKGAGIYMGWDEGNSYSSSDGGTIELISCTIINNNSQFGGGIYNYIGELRIENCDIKNNHATYVGGGLYLKKDGTFSTINSTIIDNKADDGQGSDIFNEKVQDGK